MDYSEFYPPGDKHASYVDSMGHCSGCNVKAIQRQCKYCGFKTKLVCIYLDKADEILDNCVNCKNYLKTIENPEIMYNRRSQLGTLYTIRPELTDAVKSYVALTMHNLHTELINYVACRNTSD